MQLKPKPPAHVLPPTPPKQLKHFKPPAHVLPPTPQRYGGPHKDHEQSLPSLIMPTTAKELARRAAAERKAEAFRIAAIEWREQGYVDRIKAIFTREHEPRNLDSLLEELQELVDELIARGGAMHWPVLEADPAWHVFLHQFDRANGFLGWCVGDADYTETHAHEWIRPLRTAVLVARMKDGADPFTARCLSRPVLPSPPLSPKSGRRSSPLSSGPLSPALALPRRLSSADLWGDGEWTGSTAPLPMPSPPPPPEDQTRARTQSHSLPSSRRCSINVPKEI